MITIYWSRTIRKDKRERPGPFYTVSQSLRYSNTGWWESLTSFPGLPCLQFLITCSMHSIYWSRGRPGILDDGKATTTIITLQKPYLVLILSPYQSTFLGARFAKFWMIRKREIISEIILSHHTQRTVEHSPLLQSLHLWQPPAAPWSGVQLHQRKKRTLN